MHDLTAHGPIGHHPQLMRFLNWLTPAIFAFSVVYGITALIFGDLATGLSSGVIFGYGIVLLIARQQLARAQNLAIHLVCLGFLVAASLMALLQPTLYPNLIIIPFIVVAIALPYLSGAVLWRLLIGSWAVAVVIASIGIWLPMASHIPSWFTNLLQVSAISASLAFGFFLLWQFHERLTRAIREVQATHGQLQQAYTEVEARAESQARLLAEIKQHHATIEALNVPLLPIADGTWLLPLLGALDQQRLNTIQAHTLETCHRQRAQVLVIDLTGIAALSPEAADGLVQLTHAVQLLGVEVAIVGIGAEVARTIAQSRLGVHGVQIYRDITVVLEHMSTKAHTRV
ncbi:MAG TPA: STAS domain-containing protein [Herpetosiphonaceae bacterium]